MSKLEESAITHPAKESFFNATLTAIGVAALFSSLLIYSGTVISFLRFEHTEFFVGTFVETLLLATGLIATLVVALVLVNKRIPFVGLLTGGGICYLCGSFTFAFFIWMGSQNAIATAGAALITAIGDVALCLAWGRICSRFPFKRALIYVSAASLLSAFICLLYIVLPLEAVAGLFMLCSVVSVLFSFVLGEETSQDVDALHSAEKENRRIMTILASLSDVIVAPAMGLLLFAFIMGVMRTAFINDNTLYLLALSIDASALVAYALFHRKRFALRGLHQAFLPLMAIVLLTASSITASLGQGFGVATFLTYLLYALAALLTLSTLCAVAHAKEFPTDLIFGAAVLLFAAASFAGQACSKMLPADMIGIVVTIATTLYAFAMVLRSYLKRQRDAIWEDEQHLQEAALSNAGATNVDFVSTLQQQCELISQEHKLTTREREILVYLAEGHNGSYISDILFISPNTARTHIHNIYRKIGATSREDVLYITRKSNPSS